MSPLGIAQRYYPGPAASVAALPSAERVKNDLWTDLAAAALVFLTLEWLVYHRRV